MTKRSKPTRRRTGGTVPATPKTISFAADIRPLFTSIAIQHMSWFCDLSNYENVRDHAQEILNRLQGSGGAVMPPLASGGPWAADKVQLFGQWVANGCAP
jgi:hypothetical protein